MSYLFAFELAPSSIMELDIEIPQICRINKVDETVTNVTIILKILSLVYLEITWQVEKIVCIVEIEIDFL